MSVDVDVDVHTSTHPQIRTSAYTRTHICRHIDEWRREKLCTVMVSGLVLTCDVGMRHVCDVGDKRERGKW